MNIFKIVAGLIGVATAAGGYLSFKYNTTSTCEAAKAAIVLEAPKIIDKAAEDDVGARFGKAAATLVGVEDEATAILTQQAAKEVEDKSALECAYMVVEREISPSSFRENLAESMKGKVKGLF